MSSLITYDLKPRLIDPDNESGRTEEALEKGRILYFGPGRLPLPALKEQSILRNANVPVRIKLSTDGRVDKVHGLQRGANGRIVRRALLSHGGRMHHALSRLCPSYKIDVAQLVSIYYRPKTDCKSFKTHTQGIRQLCGDKRILKFYTNLDPNHAGMWKTLLSLPQLFHEWSKLPNASRPKIQRQHLKHYISARLSKLPLLHRFSGYEAAIRAINKGIAKDKTLAERLFKANALIFPPYASWASMTDFVPHIETKGQHVVECTFAISSKHCIYKELVPRQLFRKPYALHT